jgi:hypothetical protein
MVPAANVDTAGRSDCRHDTQALLISQPITGCRTLRYLDVDRAQAEWRSLFGDIELLYIDEFKCRSCKSRAGGISEGDRPLRQVHWWY